MTAAMVLCAGLGTRLLPLTNEMPKPLMPVGDRPALAHIVGDLEIGGVSPIAVNTHHLAADFAAHLGSLAVSIRVSHEPAILGTAGGVATAAPLLGEGDVIVWNGDILALRFDVAAFVALAKAGEAAMTWVVEPRPLGEGTVGLGPDGDVVRLRGERFGSEIAGGDYLGIMHMASATRVGLPGSGCLVGDVALPLLRAGGRIASHRFSGAWDDIGQASSLWRANQRWLARRGGGAWVGEGAVVATAVTLESTLVGAGVTILGAGVVRDCVIFPGATLEAPCEGRIVGRRSSVSVADADRRQARS